MSIKIKKNFRTIKPERGLRELVGSQKVALRDQAPGTVRVRGNYIPVNHSRSGKFFGFLAFITAIISSSMMLLSSFIPSLGSTILFFFLGLVLMHTFVMIADGIGSTKVPWVENSLKLFWLVTGIMLLIRATQMFF